MDEPKSRAQRYRDRADEILARIEDFQSEENRKTMQILAEEYMAMANRLETDALDALARKSARK